jgi:hypothetical protein
MKTGSVKIIAHGDEKSRSHRDALTAGLDAKHRVPAQNEMNQAHSPWGF